jgi:hypothetical protein
LKFIVRENRSGRMGSFETDVRIPDLRKAPLRMSSVVLSSQRVPVAQKKQSGFQPLITEQTQLVPSVTHVFRQDQKLYLQYEVYDATKAKATETKNSDSKNGHPTVRVLTSIEFLQGDLKVYETKPIVAQEITAPDRKAVIFQVEIPLEGLKPGFYTCQVNIIDDVAGNYAFPRWPILVKPVMDGNASLAPAASR